MNRKQLVPLVVVLALAGIAAWMVHQNRQHSWQESASSTGQKLYADFPLNDIARVIFTNNEGGLELIKTNDQWVVPVRADFPANFTNLKEFLSKVWELKVGEPIHATQAQLARLQLQGVTKGTNSSTLVKFEDKDGKQLTSLLLGKTYEKGGEESSPYGGGGYPAGRYVMIPDKLQTVSLVSEPFSSVSTKPESWLDKDFIKVQKIKSIAVTHPEATNNWTLTRTNETAAWELADPQPGEKLDTSKVSSLNSFLSYASFNDVAVGKSDADMGFDKPTRIGIKTFDGFDYDLTVGEKKGSDDRYLRFAVSANLKKQRTAGKDEKPDEKKKLDKTFADNLQKQEDKLKSEQALTKWTYQVSKWTLDAGMKDRHELLVEKKPETKSTASTKPTATPNNAADSVQIPGVPAAHTP